LGTPEGIVLRFAGFELDLPRAELRGPDGDAIRLRPKALSLLNLLAGNAGRVVTKQEIMDAVWPNVHVGDDSLFQCIRELRTALGDDQRQLIKLVSGQGYLFTAPVSSDPAAAEIRAPLPASEPPTEASATTKAPPWLSGSRRLAAIAVAGCCAIALMAFVATMVRSGMFRPAPATIAVMPIVAADGDSEATAIAANVTERLADGLAKIETIRVSAPSIAAQGPGPVHADFAVQAELRKSERSWDVRARMTRISTGEIVWSAPVSITLEGTDVPLQQSRLAAGIGHPLAVRIGELPDANVQPAPHGTSAVIEQATASIMQTSRERFETAQAMLVKALTEDPDNVDIAVTLAALQLRGIQMVWYSPQDSAAARASARATLEHALRVKPDSIPVLEAYCRFLSATTAFVESLVACAKTLSLDPWDGMALYHIGLAQIQLGRFEDALASFHQADRFNTPEVSRWTWLLGIGWVDVLIERNEDAVPWLQRSIAITPASGRSYMLLAVAYLRLGRLDEAKAAMAKGLARRPGSTAANVRVPALNSGEGGEAYRQRSEKIVQQMIELGLPQD
jgi:DNA-binding winged helix-turn-helix (wHTH) protein/tetratricopeptide (TPR) repeat protein/TolB-like protein